MYKSGCLGLEQVTCEYDEYGMHKYKWTSTEPGRSQIVTDAIGKVCKGVSYAEALQQDS